MLVTILLLLALLIIGFGIGLTARQKKKRIIVGLVLIGSVFLYPLLVPLFGEWMALDGVASLMVFHFILLLGGLVTLITGFFTRTA